MESSYRYCRVSSYRVIGCYIGKFLGLGFRNLQLLLLGGRRLNARFKV